MHANLRKILLAAVSLGTVMTFSAQAFAETKVTMWTFLDPKKDSPRERALREIIESFETANPDIDIVVEPQIWHQLPNSFVMSASTGRAPDIAWINYPKLVVPFEAGVAADLGDLFMNDWSAEERSDFVSQAPFEAVTRDGQILAAPLFLLSNVIMYRKDLMRDAGIDAETIRSWDDFIAAGKKLTKDDNGDGQIDQWGFGVALSRDGASTNPVIPALLDLQPEIFDDSCIPTVATEAGQKALALQAGFVAGDDITSPEAYARTSDDNQDLFIAGRQAMVVGGSSRVVGNREKATWGAENMGVLAWPSWTGEKASPYVMDGWFAVAWKDSPNLDAAGKFLEFMLSAEMSKLWTFPGGQVPFRKSTLSDPRIQEPQNEWMASVANGWEQNVAFLPPACNVGALYSDLNVATQKLARGEASAENALREVEELGAERQ